MLPEQIMTPVIIVIAALLVWGIIGKVFKLMFYAGIIIFLLMAANLYFVYQDFKDIRQNFGPSAKEVLLVDNYEVLAGVILEGNDFEALSSSQLNDISAELERENYEEVLGDNYRLMIIETDIINSLGDEIDLFGQTVPKEEIETELQFGSSHEKSQLFMALLSNEILANKNPLFFFSEFKKGNIIIYPETALFRTIKFIPLDLLKNAANSIFGKAKETAKTFIVKDVEQ